MEIAIHQAKQAVPVLIVSHRLLIGAVAALHLGHRDPATIFTQATRFTLALAETGRQSPNRS